MINRQIGMRAWLALAAALLAQIGLVKASEPAASTIFEDVRISGKEIHGFAEGSESVSVVLGDFSLTAGKQSVSGRDGVVWIASEPGTMTSRHRITVYVEGQARVVGESGATANEQAILVHLITQGRLSASGNMSAEPLQDFPLYLRAVAAREQASRQPTTAPADQSVAAQRPAPELVRMGDGTPAAASKPVEPPGPKAVEPVQFSADTVTSQKLDDGRRITIATGNVYLSQRLAKDGKFLEMRSQSAVIYTEQVSQLKKTHSPASPKLPKMLGQETISGVYLEGDVRLSRGVSMLQAEQAYYDFLTDRAYVPKATFRTIQEQRDIPVYIRADEVRALSAREMVFINAKATTSDLLNPSWSIASTTAYVKDVTPYDSTGEALGPQSWYAQMDNTTYNINGVPLLWVPTWQGDFTQSHTALRKGQLGWNGKFGFGAETEWDFFRLLGMVRPNGVKARLESDWYENGVLTGLNWDYSRQEESRRYAGYGRLYGLTNGNGEDSFGDARTDIAAPETRGRALIRHKEYLPGDWELQAELSYLCDKNFLEEYWRDEYYAGKEQETVLYAKKQKDNWAFTSLLKYRLNRFDTQAESLPDLGFYLIGEPLLGDRLTLFSESHAGLMRYRTANDSDLESSDVFGRLDTRNEVDWPLRFGPINVVPYATGRATWWGDRPTIADGYAKDGETSRLYGQTGVRASTSFWRVYDAQSRLWNINGLRHIITPEAAFFVADAGGVEADDLYPLDPAIEQDMNTVDGSMVSVLQRLQTKRGVGANQHIADWMRLKTSVGAFSDEVSEVQADGMYFLSRPEYSLPRNFVNADYAWYVSDSVTFLADANYDMTSGKLGRASTGLAIQRDPRLAYFVGFRDIPSLDSFVGTVGARYQINRKYTFSVSEQYDFDYKGGQGLTTNLSVIRKFERWYMAVSFVFDQTDDGDQFGLSVSFWPEGIPEVHLGSGRIGLPGSSSEN